MKRFFVNQLVMAALAISAAFTSCNKDDDEKGDETIDGTIDGTVGGTIDKITAKVENASELSNVKTVKLMALVISSEESEEIASAEFKNDGFTLNLPATVASKYLYLLAADMPSTVNVSNKNAKIANVSICGFDSAGDPIADFICTKKEGNTEYSMWLLYADSDVSISGTKTDEEEDEVFVFSLSLKKGWNAVYETYTRTTQGEKIEYKNSPISGLKWLGNERPIFMD